jgi:hypothetical protein
MGLRDRHTRRYSSPWRGVANRATWFGRPSHCSANTFSQSDAPSQLGAQVTFHRGLTEVGTTHRDRVPA